MDREIALGYGKLIAGHVKALRPHVAGRVVHDLGAGDMEKARLLLHLGAEKVHAVEKDSYPFSLPLRIDRHEMYFKDYRPAEIDVAFLSWPSNHLLEGLLPLLVKAKTIIYLGKNTDGTSCGFPALFVYLTTRRLLVHKPHPRNTLIIVGERLRKPRAPEHEELAGIRAYDELLRYDSRPV